MVVGGAKKQPALVKGLQVGFLGLALGCHQAWKVPQSVLASQSPRAADPGTRSSWPYIRLSAARPERHPESTALNSSYMMPRGLAPISTSAPAVGPPSGLPWFSLCS